MTERTDSTNSFKTRSHLMAEVAAELLGANDSELDQRVEATLRRLAHEVGVERAYVLQSDRSLTKGSYTHEWWDPDVPKTIKAHTLGDIIQLPWLQRQFDANGVLKLNSHEDLPKEAQAERAKLEQASIKSLLLVPTGAGNERVGLTGLQSVRSNRAWTDRDVELLRLVGSLLWASIVRRQSARALEKTEALHRAIIGSLPDIAFVLSASAQIRDVLVPPDVTLPLPREKLIGAELGKLLPSSVAGNVLEHLRQTIDSGKPRTVHYTLPVRGRRQYFEVRFARRQVDDVLALVRDVSSRKETELDLKEQERLYEILTQSTREAIILGDKEGKILSWNPGAARMFGYGSHEVIGQRISLLIPNESSDESLEEGRQTDEVASFIASGKSGMLDTAVDGWGKKKDASLFPIEATLSAHTRRGETLLASVVRDVTERRDAENALRSSEQRYRQLVQHSADGILLHDETGQILDVNDRTLEMLGYTREQILGMSLDQIEQSRAPQAHREQWSAMRLDETVTLEGACECSDGRLLPVEMRVAKFEEAAAGTRLLVIARDITERKAHEAITNERREQLRLLASQLTLAEEDQRRHLAVQLHDGIAQELAMCRLRIQSYLSAPEDERDALHLDHALKFVEHAIAQVHSLTFDLSPPALHELGLPAALRSLGRRIKEDHGLNFEYSERNASEDSVEIPKDLAVLLFRSVRELAINVVKHARAKTLRVTTSIAESSVEISIEDDGVGINLDELTAQSTSIGGGFGLFSIRERLSSLQGELRIERKEGTIATIVVPLKRPESA